MMHVDEIHERAERMQSHRGRTIGSEPGYMQVCLVCQYDGHGAYKIYLLVHARLNALGGRTRRLPHLGTEIILKGQKSVLDQDVCLCSSKPRPCVVNNSQLLRIKQQSLLLSLTISLVFLKFRCSGFISNRCP